MTALFILLNILIFLAVDFTGGSENTVHMIECGAAYPPLILENGEIYRLFTCMFLHFGISHLANNMLVLADVMKNEYAVSAGASGAVFAVMGAMIYVVIWSHGQLQDISTRQILIMAAFSLYFGFTSTGVDNAAHVGGMIMGFLLAVLLYHPSSQKKLYNCLML